MRMTMPSRMAVAKLTRWLPLPLMRAFIGLRQALPMNNTTDTGKNSMAMVMTAASSVKMPKTAWGNR